MNPQSTPPELAEMTATFESHLSHLVLSPCFGGRKRELKAENRP
jgi:hypothetical protein